MLKIYKTCNLSIQKFEGVEIYKTQLPLMRKFYHFLLLYKIGGKPARPVLKDTSYNL